MSKFKEFTLIVKNKVEFYIVKEGYPIYKGDMFFNIFTGDVGYTEVNMKLNSDYIPTQINYKVLATNVSGKNIPNIDVKELKSTIYISDNCNTYSIKLETNESVCKCDTYEKMMKCGYVSGDNCNKPHNGDFYGMLPKVNHIGNVIFKSGLDLDNLKDSWNISN